MNLNDIRDECHNNAIEKGFWFKSQNIGEKLMLIVTEVAEACEADRKDDDEAFKEEIADIFIRCFDLCGFLKIDIEKEIIAKMKYNEGRPKLHGKKY